MPQSNFSSQVCHTFRSVSGTVPKCPVDSACLLLLIPETSFPASALNWFGVDKYALDEWVASYLRPRDVRTYSCDTFGLDIRIKNFVCTFLMHAAH